METDMIKITHLKKSFGDVKAVNDLSFQVKKGELFAFLGVNGAGKSTLMNILTDNLLREEHNDFDHLRAASQRQRNGSDPGHRSG